MTENPERTPLLYVGIGPDDHRAVHNKLLFNSCEFDDVSLTTQLKRRSPVVSWLASIQLTLDWALAPMMMAPLDDFAVQKLHVSSRGDAGAGGVLQGAYT